MAHVPLEGPTVAGGVVLNAALLLWFRLQHSKFDVEMIARIAQQQL